MAGTATCEFRCPGCPGESVAQNINTYKNLNPSDSGLVLFMKALETAGRLIDDGATTPDEILETPQSQTWLSPPLRMHGELSSVEIVASAVACKIREFRGDCTLPETTTSDAA